MAAAPPQFSDLLNDTTKWISADPTYAAFLPSVGHQDTAAGITADGFKSALVNIAHRSPVAVAFVMTGDEDHIYVGHSPRIYPTDMTNTSPMDGLLVLLVGDDPNSCTPVVIPDAALTRTAQIRCLDIPTIVGATGHGATPPIFRAGPHAAAAAPDRMGIQRIMLFPCADAARAVSTHKDGRYSLTSFYHEWITGKYDSASPDDVARYAPMAWFFRGASTNATGDVGAIRVAPVVIGLPNVQARLNSFVSLTKTEAMARLGHGGPGLSNAAFGLGVADICQTLEDTAEAALTYNRDSKLKTFADKHGDALERRILRFCNVATEASLPEAHRLLLQAPKNKEYSILTVLFTERAERTSLPISSINAPLATPSLVDHVFRGYNPANNGLTLGSGLTPFHITCDGHGDIAAIKALIKKAELVEGGTSLSLNDASVLTSNTTALPTEVFVAIEKLCGWSVVADVFHGAATPIATNIRNAVDKVHPHLHRLVAQTAVNEVVGMELVNRVLFEFQQDYYAFLNELATATTPTAVEVPTFRRIQDAVTSHRASSLCMLPASWYSSLQGDEWEQVSGKQKKQTPRDLSGTAARVNPKADRALLSRYKDSGHTSIAALIGSHDVEIPKHQGQPICLTWALKGACSAGCKRKDQHKTYGRTTNQQIHALLDTCGVANPQP